MAAKEMEKQKKRSSSVCRVFKNTAYAVMSNYHLMSTAISLKATGLLSKVLNLPDKWDYSVKGLASICKEKETAIETALDELKDTGYLCVTKLFPNQTENKKIGYRYHFFEYSEKDKTVHIKPTDFVTIEKACGSNGSKVCRVTKNANYTVMSSFFLRSKKLSLKAIGLLCKVLSLPDNWDYSIDGLTAICKDGRTVIKSALKELETWGYLKKTRLKPNETESGRFEYFYDFYEISDKDVPQEETSALSTGDAKKTKAVSKKYARQGVCSQEAEIQEEEKQGVENLSIENRQQYNTKDKIQKNQICSDKVSINQSLSCAENAVENVENTIYSQSEDWIDGLMADKAKAEAQVRKNIDYDEFAEWIMLFGKEYMSVSELNKIVRIIVKGICSKLPRQTICEEEYTRKEIATVMLEVDRECIEKALEITRQNFDVRYRDSYFFSVLFNQAYSKEFTRNDEARAIDYDIKTTFGGI